MFPSCDYWESITRAGMEDGDWPKTKANAIFEITDENPLERFRFIYSRAQKALMENKCTM